MGIFYLRKGEFGLRILHSAATRSRTHDLLSEDEQITAS